MFDMETQKQFDKWAKCDRQTAFSLVELMVTLVVVLLVVNGVFRLVSHNQQLHDEQLENALIHDNARYALSALTDEIQMAGFMGCAFPKKHSPHIAIDDTALTRVSMSSVVGYRSDDPSSAAAISGHVTPQHDSDILVVMSARPNESQTLKTDNIATGSLIAWSKTTFPHNEIVLLEDVQCRHSGIFELTAAVTENSQWSRYDIFTGKEMSEQCADYPSHELCQRYCGNDQCSQVLRGFLSGSKIMPLRRHVYYIAPSIYSPGNTALFREVWYGAGREHVNVQELVHGIVGLRIRYGIDENDDGAVDHFHSANKMDVNRDGKTNYLDWDAVVAVHFEMTFQSRVSSLTHSPPNSDVDFVNSGQDSYVLDTMVRLRNSG